MANKNYSQRKYFFLPGPTNLEGASEVLTDVIDNQKLITGINNILFESMSNGERENDTANDSVSEPESGTIDPQKRYIDQMRVIVTETVKKMYRK